MATSLCPPNTQARTSHNTMLMGLRKDWDEYLQECLCKVPPRIRMLAPPTWVVIKEIIESPVDSGVSAPKKEQTLPAIEGFAPSILSLPRIAKPSPGFFRKGTNIIPAIRGFNPLVLPKPIQGISRAPSPKTLEATLPSPVIIGLKMFSLAPNLQT